MVYENSGPQIGTLVAFQDLQSETHSSTTVDLVRGSPKVRVRVTSIHLPKPFRYVNPDAAAEMLDGWMPVS